jgi:hypothetical protein
MSKPYLDRVVISPHLYGPSVSHRKDFYKVLVLSRTIACMFDTDSHPLRSSHSARMHVYSFARHAGMSGCIDVTSWLREGDAGLTGS